MQQKDFWQALMKVGQEVLDQAETVGFGMSDVQIKYADNHPVIVIRSHSENRKYASTEAAMADIARELSKSIADDFDGTRSITPVFNHGKITRVIIDDYRNIAI